MLMEVIRLVRKGLPASYIKKWGVSKRAWREYKKGKKKNPSRTRKKAKTRRKGGYKMARRKKRRRGGKSITQQVFKWIRVGALVAPGVGQAIRWKDSGGEIMASQVVRVYTGYDWVSGQWKWEWLTEGWMPYLGSILATKGIQKLSGIIRRL